MNCYLLIVHSEHAHFPNDKFPYIVNLFGKPENESSFSAIIFVLEITTEINAARHRSYV